MIRITSGDLSIVINPISKESKLKPVRFGSDIALISRNLPDFNGVDEVSRKDKEPFVIDGPGEYEINGVFVKGTASKSEYQKPGINTIYAIKLDDVNLIFLGALSEPKPGMSFMEDIDSVDVVFVPIGDEGVLNHVEAYKLAVSLEPKLIIPIHFQGLGDKSALKNFVKEVGSKAEPQEKYVFKKKDLEALNGELIVLQA